MPLITIFDLPFRLLWKLGQSVIDQIGKVLLKDSYMKSNLLWVERHRLGAHWTKSDAGFDYSVEMALVTDHELRQPRIALRQTQEPIKKISFMFVAESAGVFYQHRIEAVDVGTKPVVLNLSNIPRQALPIVSATGPRFTWDTYNLSDVTVHFLSGETKTQSESLTSALTQTWFWQSKWVYRWGRHWNLNAIKNAQDNIALYWRYGFGYPVVVRFSPHCVRPRMPPLRYVASRLIAWIFGTHWASRSLFWLALWSGLYSFDNSGKFSPRWLQTQRLHSH